MQTVYMGSLTFRKDKLGDKDKIQLAMTVFHTVFVKVKFNPKELQLMF